MIFFLTLLDLNKHKMELNISFPIVIESKFTENSIIANRSVGDMNHKLLTLQDYQEQLVYNLSALGNEQSTL